MLRLIPPDRPLDAAERHAMSVLLDLSRVLVTAEGRDAVELQVVGAGEAVAWQELARAGHGVTHGDGVLRLDRRALNAITRIAGAVAEQRSNGADRYGRVPHDDNECVRAGVEQEPVVHHVASALRAGVAAAAGRRPVLLIAPWPAGHRWAVAMTHDLDVVARWPVFTALRIAELARKGELGRAARVASAAARSALGDPVWAAARHVLETERRAGMRSTWFIITGTPTLDTMRAGDITYVPESRPARRIIESVSDAGHELGLHGSFETFGSPAAFVQQRERLTVIARRPIHGVRQHFIRMRPGATHREMAAAGFQYDSTFGFSDRNGFRIGVADVVPVWDDAAGRALALDALPFLWMDRAFSKYRGIEDPDAWIDDALRLARRCEDIEGAWCGIWHPNLSTPLGFPGATEAFARLCAGLMATRPWSATMGDLVRWRRMRRQARLAEPGPTRPRVQVPAGPFDIALEDAAGTPVPFDRA